MNRSSTVKVLIPEEFKEFVTNKVKEQEKIYVKKKRLNMMVFQEFKTFLNQPHNFQVIY